MAVLAALVNHVVADAATDGQAHVPLRCRPMKTIVDKTERDRMADRPLGEVDGGIIAHDPTRHVWTVLCP